MHPPDAGKGAEMAELVCGGCRTSLTYIHGATRVQCPCCHTVNHALEVVEMKIDRISHLSDHIIDEILSRMSTKDVVRTSLLSRKWRHKWTTTSSLAFGERFSHPQTFNSFRELVRIINHVLSHHVGPIHKFKLYYNFGLKERCDYCRLDTASNQEVDRWILHLSKGHIEELSLTFDNLIQRYMMPSCIFSCQNLTKLELCRCSLGSPGTFKGFGNLKVLRLINVILAQDLLEILLCCSPLLEWAYLWIADVVQDTKVDTPKYRFFEFVGRFTDCSALDILSTKADRFRTLGINGMPKFFCHLLHVRSLTLKGSFLEYLALGGLPREFLLHDLQYLSMSVNFSHQKEVSAALWLLRSAPNLQELNILEQEGSVDGNVEPIFWEADHMNRLYTRLRRVRMDYILGSEREIYIINYLLSTSPVLETMTINLIFPTSKSMVQQSLCFRNASEQVKIIFN